MTGERPDDPDALGEVARQAIANGQEEAAEARLTNWLCRNRPEPSVLHWTAMLRRALDRRVEAIIALKQASQIEPANPGIAHALAHVTLEAGKPASRLFELALRLAPAKAEIRLGLASARFAEGEGARGLAELDAVARQEVLESLTRALGALGVACSAGSSRRRPYQLVLLRAWEEAP